MSPTPVLSSRSAQARVLDALGSVRDPELDEPVTDLGFVASCTVSDDGVAEVHLRLPTYFCAPNFAFLMVADAQEAVSAVPGISRTVICLDDHFASETINAGVAARSGFVASFGAEAADELDDLRRNFTRRAVLAGTDRVARPLLTAGVTVAQLALTTLDDIPPSPDLERLRARRSELGLPAGDDALLLLDPESGAPVPAAGLAIHLGRARLSRVSAEANTGICRGMLAQRYSTTGEGEKP